LSLCLSINLLFQMSNSTMQQL